MGAQIILGNTFHLWLRPGIDVIRPFDGLHRFEGWSQPILTDSGGFQVWSLGAMRTISEEGVRFASPVNGDQHVPDPEVSMQIQTVLDSDIVMQFDECTPYETGGPHHHRRRRRARRWSCRCAGHGVASTNSSAWRIRTRCSASCRAACSRLCARSRSAQLAEMNLPGYAIGGISVGEPKQDMRRIVAHTPQRLPPHKPRYLMGVGTPEDLVDGVAHGVDLFDCVMPTRNARNGHLFTRFGDLRLRNARYKDDPRPIDETCSCHACADFQPRLPAPPRPLRRDAGADAHQHPQPALLPEPDARDARGDRAATLCRLARPVRGRPLARPMKPLTTVFRRAFGVLIALLVLFEEWGWGRCSG